MIECCRREIAAVETALLAANPDGWGLWLALAEWSAELWLLEQEVENGTS
jgi:hypothetical protein